MGEGGGKSRSGSEIVWEVKVGEERREALATAVTSSKLEMTKRGEKRRE